MLWLNNTLQYKMSIVILDHHVGRVFFEGEVEEGPELKGSVTAILRFRGEFSSERFGGITTRTLMMSAT